MNKAINQPTPRTMARKLRTLARQMRRMGEEMEYIGGFDDQMTAKARQLLGASRMVDTWADGIAKEGGR